MVFMGTPPLRQNWQICLKTSVEYITTKLETNFEHDLESVRIRSTQFDKNYKKYSCENVMLACQTDIQLRLLSEYRWCPYG